MIRITSQIEDRDNDPDPKPIARISMKLLPDVFRARDIAIIFGRMIQITIRIKDTDYDY